MIYPAMNTLWFWFDKQTRRDLHGTLEDCERKYTTLMDLEKWDGLEIFLIPSRLAGKNSIAKEFQTKFKKLSFKSVHIGDSDPDFLDSPSINDDLKRLYQTLESLDAHQIILHAHHLKANMHKRISLLSQTLPGIDILIENNGFDANWGWRPNEIVHVLSANPNLGLCLDIAHVHDFKSICLDDFLSQTLLKDRLREIHVSASTYLMEDDPYVAKGFSGYQPFHALFAVLDEKPPQQLMKWFGHVPMVMEGVLPKEDRNLTFLKKERSLFGGVN